MTYGQEINCSEFYQDNDNQLGVVFEKGPEPIGGIKEHYLEGTDSLKCGKIFIQVVIDKQGKPQCARVAKSDNGELNDQAIRLIEGLSFTPAEQRGKPMISMMVLPVVFGEKKTPDKKKVKSRRNG